MADGETGMDRLRLDDVVIVKYKDVRALFRGLLPFVQARLPGVSPLHGAEVIDQRGQDRLDGDWLGGMMQSQGRLAKTCLQPAQRREYIGPKLRGLIVADV